MLKSLFSHYKEPSSNGAFVMKLFILLVFILGTWLAYSIFHVILAIAFAAFLVMLFSPFLNWCNRHRIADWLGIVIIYIIILLLVILLFLSIIPIFASQTVALIKVISTWFAGLETAYRAQGFAAFGLPHFLSNIIGNFDWNDMFTIMRSNFGSIGSTVSGNLQNIASQGVGVISFVGNTVFSILTTFVFAFFLALNRHAVREFFYDILPVKTSKYIESREEPIMHTLASWFRGQMILSVTVFLFVYIGLWILHAFGIAIENKATLALIAGLLESVPYFGPIIALIPALALAGSISGYAVVAVIILYFIIQQLEGQILVPVIMSKSLDLSAFFVLVVMAIGASLAGVLGILLAVPIAAIIDIGVKDFLEYKKKQKL